MLRIPKATALAIGLVGALSMVTLAQQPQPGSAVRSPGETLVLTGQIDWLEKSDVTCLREGVIKSIEFNVGDLVAAGQPIGYLHDETAELTVAKADIAAKNVGAIEKAKAAEELSKVQLAMLYKLIQRNPANVSFEERKKAEAEVLAAGAAVKEAEEQQALAKAELAIARRILEEHTIYAPFTGYVTDRMKGPEESVRASDAVLRMVRIDKLRFHGYLPLESAVRIHEGDLVEVRPVIDDAELPIEKVKFTGKVKSLGREVSTIGRTDIQVLAEIDNKFDPTGQHKIPISDELLKGMKAEITIFLNTAGPAAVGARPTATPSR